MVDDADWVTMGADIKGDIYESLLERNAEDTKSGAGQYFTPRALIRAMVECVRPEPGKRIADPACGTGGFFLAAYDFITHPDHFKLDKEQKAFLKYEAFHGNEIVVNTRRLCLMNMFLHNIGEIEGGAPISANDSLVADAGERFDYVLANPPFGKKSSMSFTNEEGEQEKDELTYNRQDFWATTSNKQLNFVQHIRTMLKTTGRAAVVVPDNVLFEGGAGETIRKKLLDNTGLHTILRLPTGVFYAQGVKANVIFSTTTKPARIPGRSRSGTTTTAPTFTTRSRKSRCASSICRISSNATTRRTGTSVRPLGIREKRLRAAGAATATMNSRPATRPALTSSGSRNKSLTDLDNLPEPDVLAAEIIENLEAGLSSFREVLAGLERSPDR